MAGPPGIPGPGVPFTIFTATSRAIQTVLPNDLATSRVRFPDTLADVNSPVTKQGDTEFLINTSGWYEVGYHFSLSSNTSDFFRFIYSLRQNNSYIYESESRGTQAFGAQLTEVSFSGTVYLNLSAGAVITLDWRQMSGTPTTTYTIFNPYIWFQKVGD